MHFIFLSISRLLHDFAVAKTHPTLQHLLQLLIQALLELISTEPYSHITVQDIVDQANVGRSTFYVHFQDKDDLLRNSFGAVP